MATIHELHKKLVNKEISAVELTNAVSAHKAKVEPTVHAYLSDSHDRALATAKLVDEAIAKVMLFPHWRVFLVQLKIIFVLKMNLQHVHLKCWKTLCLHTMHQLLNVYKTIIILALVNLIWMNLLWVVSRELCIS